MVWGDGVKGKVYFKDGHVEGITSWYQLIDGIDFETISGEYWYEEGGSFIAEDGQYYPVSQFFTYDRDSLLFREIDYIDHIELFDGGEENVSVPYYKS